MIKSTFCFRCSRKNFKKIFPLFDRSFFEPFKKTNLDLPMEILKCFIKFKFNCKEALNYLSNINHYTVREKFILDFYTAIREVIYK